ncbi:MAG: hypothetical protein E7671_03795 [Ruminococcaceae bacterium]|nr:hypothetical protein [Oscillospiraceae bacterium]
MSDGGVTPSLGTPPSPEALSGMIKMLSANPDLVKNIATAFGNAGITPPTIEKENTDNSTTQAASTNDEDLSSRLGGILSALSQSGNNSEKNALPQSEEAPAVSASALPSIPPELISKLPLLLSLIGGGGPKSKSEADREALLCALKPYLSHEKADTIDRLIKLSRLGDILKSL